MSSTLLCEILLQKTQWETGRGLIALTLADSGQRQHSRTADEGLLPHTIHLQFFIRAAALTYYFSTASLENRAHTSQINAKMMNAINFKALFV